MIDFETFYRRKTDFYEKKTVAMLRLPNNVVWGITFSPFNLETSPLKVINILMLRGAYSGSSEAKFLNS
jgi:hypothetical protein